MGFHATLAVLRTLPRDEALPYLEASLAEPYEEIQGAAFDLLADPQGWNRLDILVRSFPTLLPGVRKRILDQRARFIEAAKEQIRGTAEKTRRAAYELLAAIGEVEVAGILAVAVNDASTVIRESAANALEKLALRYHFHLLDAQATGEEKSRLFVEQNRPLMLEALQTLLRSFQIHRKSIFIDVAIEMGEPAYRLLTDFVLSRSDSPVFKAFVQCMGRAHSESSMELLFRMYFERKEQYREAAVTIMRSRKDLAFPVAIASWLGRVTPERFLQISTQTRELPWWEAVEQNPDLEPISANKLIEFVTKSFLDPPTRDSAISVFFRSKYAEVRARTLSALRELRSPLTLEIATMGLQDPIDAVKLAAAETIVDLKPPGKTRLLVPLVSSENEELRRIAIQEVAKESFPRYMKSFDRLDERTRELAAKALAKIDASMMERLAEELASLEPKRRLKALRIIDYAEAERDLRPLLLELISDPDTHVRAAAIKTVELSGSVEGMKLLIAALNDEDRRVRANAIEAFEEIGDQRFASLLLPFVKDPDNRVRANAAKALWILGHKEVREVLEAMLEDPDEDMRLSAVWALGELNYEGASGALSRLFDRESSERVRAKAAEVLKRISSPKGAGG